MLKSWLRLKRRLTPALFVKLAASIGAMMAFVGAVANIPILSIFGTVFQVSFFVADSLNSNPKLRDTLSWTNVATYGLIATVLSVVGLRFFGTDFSNSPMSWILFFVTMSLLSWEIVNLTKAIRAEKQNIKQGNPDQAKLEGTGAKEELLEDETAEALQQTRK